MVNEMNRIKEMIRAKGYKLTPQRRATLDVILRNEGKHMSTEEVFQEVKKTCPEIGLATVYRTMLLLEEAQILQRHNFDDGKNRYELKHPDEDHHHLICKKCGKVIEVEDDLLEDLESKIQEKYSFRIEEHKVQFTGLCTECIDGII
ncbi:MAG: Fur family transcriptional regulator [Caldicoprobacterales bacterium]|jgi:Fur family ferric uptake transcriptional regulator|nr:transcriptional repressor [Clostridiales bacterium]